MKLSAFYRAIIDAGIKADPRPRKLIRDELERRRRDFDKLDDEEKSLFDEDALFNPYSDTRILHGSGDEEIGRLLVGIDVDPGELALADRLREREGAVDLVLAHHPSGRALAGLHDVMRMQVDMLHALGVPISAAEDLMDMRVKEIERRLLPANHLRASDAARLLGIPLVCAHTPADNHVTRHLQTRFSKETPHRLGDVIEMLMEEPEYREATRHGVQPRILLGSKERRAGKIFVEMTGGTSGARKMFAQLAVRGVDTIVGMHITEEYREEAKKHHLNVVIAGHISSDTLGMNLLLDEVSRKADGALEVIECSGFRRVSRL
jgi:putative NIF3 family GTP cyclohydrolase 1 type 2